MQAVLAVTHELFEFVFTERFGSVATLPVEVVPTAPVNSVPKAELTSAPAPDLVSRADLAGYEGSQVFVKESKTPLRVLPGVVADGVLLEIPFSAGVLYHRTQANYAEITYGEHRGWVEISSLALKKTEVIPTFTEGQLYSADNPATKRLRALINNEFHAEESAMVLQDIEYILYRLQQRGTIVVWPAIRPRPAGKWQDILKGRTGVHISVTPKTDAVMEVKDEDGAKIAFVEAVFPDQSIRIAMISNGVFSNKTISVADWREWQPIFISFT